MDFSIDMLSIGDADAIIFWVKRQGKDYIIFLDGGKPGDGKVIIGHFKTYIEPHLTNPPNIFVINSHPHRDHIGGLPEIIKFFGSRISKVYFNNPLSYINTIQRNLITEYYNKKRESKISDLYESLKDVDNFNQLLSKYGLVPLKLFSDTILDHDIFKVIGPSKAFYIQKVQFFTDITSLENMNLLRRPEEEINIIEEGQNPCKILDEKNDTSAENLTSTIIQLTDSGNRRYLFTADSGVDSFESAVANDINMENFHIVQMPHHGSRRNINTNWINKLNPKQYWISAEGNDKHPRKAVITCIKKNLTDCKIYSTHKSGNLNINTNGNLFPDRGWAIATPL